MVGGMGSNGNEILKTTVTKYLLTQGAEDLILRDSVTQKCLNLDFGEGFTVLSIRIYISFF